MIHLLTWLPLQYQQTLCRALQEHYGSDFIVWFAESEHLEFPYKSNTGSDLQRRYLNKDGYGQLFRALRSDSAAVVILGGWRSPMTVRVLFITALLRVPVFIWADHPHPRNRGPIIKLVRQIYLSLVSKLAVGFLACGEPTRRHLISSGIKEERTVVFPYWTELPANWLLPAGCPNGETGIKPLRLIAIGRVVSVKQFDIAIRAVAIANDRAGHPIAHLTIAGDGPERNSLEQLVRTTGCQDQVTFLGWLEADDALREIRAADALVVTSNFEGYSAVVLEAMAAGRPVLASDGVIAAIDRNEDTGAVLFHKVGDAETLATQIAAFAHDRSRLREASIAARATAEKWPLSRAIEILNSQIERTDAGKRIIRRTSDVERRPSFNSTGVNV